MEVVLSVGHFVKLWRSSLTKRIEPVCGTESFRDEKRARQAGIQQLDPLWDVLLEKFLVGCQTAKA